MFGKYKISIIAKIDCQSYYVIHVFDQGFWDVYSKIECNMIIKDDKANSVLLIWKLITKEHLYNNALRS